MRALRRGAAAAAGLAVLAAGASAQAQLAAKGGPIDATGDKQQLFSDQHKMVITGRVEVLQGENRLRCDKLVIYYRNKAGGHGRAAPASAVGSGMTDLDHVEATGNVYLVSPNEVVRGDQAVYTAGDDTTVVTGHVVLTRGENVAEGRRLVVNQSTGVATLEGGEGLRPRTIIFPKHDEAGPSQ